MVTLELSADEAECHRRLVVLVLEYQARAALHPAKESGDE